MIYSLKIRCVTSTSLEEMGIRVGQSAKNAMIVVRDRRNIVGIIITMLQNATIIMHGLLECCVFVRWHAGLHVLIDAVRVLVRGYLLVLRVRVAVAGCDAILISVVMDITGVSRSKNSMFVEGNWRNIVGVIVAMTKNVTVVMLSTAIFCVFVCWHTGFHVLILAIGVLISGPLRLNEVSTVAVVNTILLDTVSVGIPRVSRAKDTMIVVRNWRNIVGVVVAMF